MTNSSPWKMMALIEIDDFPSIKTLIYFRDFPCRYVSHNQRVNSHELRFYLFEGLQGFKSIDDCDQTWLAEESGTQWMH